MLDKFQITNYVVNIVNKNEVKATESFIKYAPSVLKNAWKYYVNVQQLVLKIIIGNASR